MSLVAEIQNLIETKREGTYWDFKEVHHENKACLLHDVLCLANVAADHNRYLIFGVSDPGDGCEIVGLEGTARKNQSDIIDFLRSKHFAGDNRPEVELRTLTLDDKEIDVLIVFNSRNKPFYLSENYRNLKANYIYTRTLDTNTPIDKSASYSAIEKMWRERFGLDVQPAKRMVELLRHPGDWEKDIGNNKIGYHKYSPEYNFIIEDSEAHDEIYNYFYPNDRGFYAPVKFQYIGTELFGLEMIYLDEMRLIVPCPKNGGIPVNDDYLVYHYYELDSIEGAFLEFLTNGEINFYSRCGEAPFLVFNSEEDHGEFLDYVRSHINEFADYPISSKWKIGNSLYRQKASERSSITEEEVGRIRSFYDHWMATR